MIMEIMVNFSLCFQVCKHAFSNFHKILKLALREFKKSELRGDFIRKMSLLDIFFLTNSLGKKLVIHSGELVETVLRSSH